MTRQLPEHGKQQTHPTPGSSKIPLADRIHDIPREEIHAEKFEQGHGRESGVGLRKHHSRPSFASSERIEDEEQRTDRALGHSDLEQGAPQRIAGTGKTAYPAPPSRKSTGFQLFQVAQKGGEGHPRGIPQCIQR